MNTDYLQGYVDALKALSAQVDAVIKEELAKAKENKDKAGFESFGGGSYVALLIAGERIARATTDLVDEVMAK